MEFESLSSPFKILIKGPSLTSPGELNVPVTASAIIGLCHSKVASVLKFEHLVAPAGPSGLETPGEQLQTPGVSSDQGPQHVWRSGKRRRGMTTGVSERRPIAPLASTANS